MPWQNNRGSVAVCVCDVLPLLCLPSPLHVFTTRSHALVGARARLQHVWLGLGLIAYPLVCLLIVSLRTPAFHTNQHRQAFDQRPAAK